MPQVFVLGGYQSDFARHLGREGTDFKTLLTEVIEGAVVAANVEPADLEVFHVGNFVGEVLSGQGQLGGLIAAAHPAFAGRPGSRHEAACASGSMAVLSAMADIEAGRYDLACVVGVELQRHVDAAGVADALGAAAFRGHEATDAKFLWPYMFSELAQLYERRFGLARAHLAAIARQNFDAARRNPNAQTRRWTLSDADFGEADDKNPVVEGWMRRHDCSQITDGAACVLLASANWTQRYAQRRGQSVESLARILGWGHRTAPIGLAHKLQAAEASNSPWLFPEMRGAIADAWQRAGIEGIDAIDTVELHDCFTISEYTQLEHLGLAPLGRGFEAIESGRIAATGKTPVNPSGGLIGGGHPVGATGVRMLLDAVKQVTGRAGDYQVAGAKRAQTVNIGGSATTTASFVVGT